MSEYFTSFDWVDAIGMIGTMMIVGAYFASQMRYINSSDLLFPILNLIGASLLTLSLVFKFNMAAFTLEVFWIIISLLGIGRCLKQRETTLENE